MMTMMALHLFRMAGSGADVEQRRTVAFELNRRVFDAESFAEKYLEILQDVLTIRQIIDQNMGAQGLLA